MGFAIVTLVVCMLAAWEWGQLSGFTSTSQRVWLAVLCGLLLAAMLFLLPEYHYDVHQPMVEGSLWASFAWWIVALLLVLSYPASAAFWRHSKVLRLIFGILTIVPFFWGMLALRAWHYADNHYSGALWLLYVMILVWGADSGAYMFGKMFGKHKLSPMSFYGLSKVTVEQYLELYHRIFGLDYVVLRFANVYGERQGDGGEGGVISIFTKSIAAGNEITIFGDGEQTRDFVYAGDIAAGIWAALHTATPNAAYNLSTQTETSLRELVNILSNIAGRRIEPKYGPERAGDIYKSMLSNARARRGLGWKPAVSLEDGLRRTYEYFVNKG